MVRCKNAGGAPSDRDDSPPRRTEIARGKQVKIAAKKRKRTLIEAEIAQAVADAADVAERGGRSSGIHIRESRFHLEGRQLGTDAIEETVEAIEETVDAPAEQPTEDPQEIEEQTAQTPQRRRSGRTRAQVTPRSLLHIQSLHLIYRPRLLHYHIQLQRVNLIVQSLRRMLRSL
jgi:hypothetical protein